MTNVANPTTNHANERGLSAVYRRLYLLGKQAEQDARQAQQPEQSNTEEQENEG